MKFTLTHLMLVAAIAAPVSAQEKSVKDILAQKGLPKFTAKSIDPRGNSLVCHDLEILDVSDGKVADKLRGLALLYCEPWDSLYLWAASVDIKMQRAAPFFGKEGPGANVLDEIPVTLEPSKLFRPARVFAVIIDERGMVSRTAEFTVHELRFKD